jgi:ABC-type cobalamin/Fe3+-siderophores transport system ATPase subunit
MRITLGRLQEELSSIAFAFTVIDYVLLGRIPHMVNGSPPSSTDLNAVYEVLERFGVGEFASSRIDELSGGERQRVLIARGGGTRHAASDTRRTYYLARSRQST